MVPKQLSENMTELVQETTSVGVSNRTLMGILELDDDCRRRTFVYGQTSSVALRIVRGMTLFSHGRKTGGRSTFIKSS